MAYAANWYRENGAALEAERQKKLEVSAKATKNAVRGGISNNNMQIEAMRQRGQVHSFFD